MLKSFFKTGWKNLINYKASSAINIFGLAIGFASCLLILQYVIFELSYDRFHTKSERTYRITNDRIQNGKLTQHGTMTFPNVGPTMFKDFPEVEEYTRIMPGEDLNIRIGTDNFKGDRSLYADVNFFNVFDFRWLAGDKETALKDPYTAVLTETIARKYFDTEDDDFKSVLGRTFLNGLDQRPLEVRGVCEEIPANSHLKFDVLLSYQTNLPNAPEANNSWTWSGVSHYLVLKPGVKYKILEAKFPEFSDLYLKGEKVTGSIEKFYLQPVKNVHLYSDYEYDIAATASSKTVWAMLVVAIFIMVIAWINYTNLTTLRANDRAKEAGIRKAMGASRSQLHNQFITESILIIIASIIMGLGIVLFLQPFFNKIIGNELSCRLLAKQLTIYQFSIVAICLSGGIAISVFYPAFVFSNHQLVKTLKRKISDPSKGNFLRKALVVFQFTTSAALISGTFIVSQQIRFMKAADLGINLKDVLVIQPPGLVEFDSTFIKKVEDFKYELMKIPGVVNATTSYLLPGDRAGRAFNIRINGQPDKLLYTVSHMGVDFDYFKTMGIKLLAGRDFIFEDHRPDLKVRSTIINKSAMNLFGFLKPEEAIGQEIIWGKNKWMIIGVAYDYHQEALQKPIEPMVFRPAYITNSPISVKIQTNNIQQLLSQVQATYKEFYDFNSFEYTFLKERYNSQYDYDIRFGTIVSIFTLLSIMVACLGLIGLSSFAAIRRTKEIGIRKVLGATVAGIVSNLSIEFVRLVVLAFILSLPITYYSMSKWLETYAYRISLDWMLFLLPGVIIIVIAVLTIGFIVLKAALTKPADTLKYE